MTDQATLLTYQQGNDVAPPPEGYAHVTNPLNPLLRSANRLAHFTDGVYDLSAESHLMKLLKVLLGEAGVGGAQKAMLLVRLQQTLGGTHFFDLDAFYGGIFGVNRALGEHLAVDPQRDIVPASSWDQIRLSDASYRSRASRLSAAFQLGATAKGIEAVAEAMTGIEFDVIEHWMYPAYRVNTWTYWDSFTWDAMEAFTWDALEFSESGSTETPRNIVTLFPHEPLTPGERFDVERALDRVKPVTVLVNVADAGVDAEIIDIPFAASSASEKWEVRQRIRNSRINGILPYPDYPEDEFIDPPSSPWANYSGEAWTVLDRNPRILAYTTPIAIATDVQLDPTAVDMTPQAFLQVSGTTQSVSLPEYALKPVQGLYSGRAVSDGIILTNPYGGRDTGQSGMLIDHIDATFIAEQIQSMARTGTRFWTTPIRGASDTSNDVLGIRFDEPVMVNHVSFDYARFPCTFEVQVWDEGVGQWISLGVVRNQDSSPYGIGNQPPPDAVHAFHYGSDHWGKASLSFDARIGQHWRIIGVRHLGVGPVGLSGTAIPYPIGIRDLDMGYRINSLINVPNVSPIAPVNVGRNIVGLQVEYYLHRDRAAYVSDSLPTAWICEPQPIRDAVVCMYLKFKSATAVVNQIYADPVHSGALVNLYYTDAIPAGEASGVARDDVLYPVATGGSVSAEPSGENRGLTLGSGEPAWVDFNLDDVGGVATSMWMGREYILDEVMLMNSSPRAAHLDAIGTATGSMMLIHGVFNTGGTHYTYFVDAVRDGVRARCAWATDDLPGRGARLRLSVQFTTGQPVLLAQIGDGPIIDSRAPINTAVDALPNGLEVPTYMLLDGAVSSIATTPFSAKISVAGDIEIVCRISPTTITGVERCIVTNSDLNSYFPWQLGLTATGRLAFDWYRTAVLSDVDTSAVVPFSSGQTFWVKVTLDVDNGAAGHTVSFYTAADQDDEPTVWNTLEVDVTPGVSSMMGSSFPIKIGHSDVGFGGAFPGKIGRVIVRKGIGGPAVVDFNADDATTETGYWYSSATHEKWQLQGGARVVFPTGPYLSHGVERFGSSTRWYCFARLTLAVNGYGLGPMEAFFEDPDRYAFAAISGANPYTEGTFIRFHPNYIGWTYGEGLALGFVGGTPDLLAAASWTPIGQYVLTKGTISFPDVFAAAIKMEFTSLIAEPFEPFIPVNTSVARINNITPESQGWSMTDVEQASIFVHSADRFGDVIRGVSAGQDSLVNFVSPTTAVVVIDGTVRDQLATRLGFGYNMSQWQGSSRGAIQATAGQHVYQTTEVQSISRTAFFVGLRTVAVQRKIDRSLGDGKAYDDSMLDTSNIDVPNTTFEIEPGQLFTPSFDASSILTTPRVAISLPFYSRRPVRALQFSTQQTGPVQLIPDDEFRDPSLISYDFSNTSSWHNSGDAIIFWDQGAGAVRVSRNPSVLDAFYAPDTPIVHPPVSPVLASGFARTVTLDFGSYGGISSPSVAISPRGVLYVGCRVAAWNELSGPLALRVYGSDETTVLAETLFTPQLNVQTEVVLPYVINNTTLDRIVQVRVEQTGPYMDSWVMYALSAFDTSVLWEFSVDDGVTWTPGHTARGLKYGVIAVPYSGSALRWKVTAYRYNCVIDAIRMRPWYLDRLGSEL